MEYFDLQATWMVLKPLCDTLIQNPNVENTKNVMKQVENISNIFVQDLLEYLLFPLILHMKNDNLSKDVKLYMVDLIRILITKSRIKKMKLFQDIYAILRIQIATNHSSVKDIAVISGHEELKKSVMTCIKTLIQKSTSDIIEAYYVRDNAVKLAHGIYLCILLATTEKSISVRLSALETATYLLQVHDEVDETDIVLRYQIGDVIMLFFPGVVCGLLEVALGGETQHHSITVMAIRIWGRVITLIMKDVGEPDIPSIESLLKKPEKETFSDPLKYSRREQGKVDLEQLKTAQRTPEWYNTVATKLNILIEELNTIAKHSHYKVRFEMQNTLKLILLFCTRNMQPCFSNLLRVLITLSEDESSIVAAAAKETLNSLSEKCKDMKPLIEQCEDNLYDLLTKLPRIIRTSDDATQLSFLNELTGYIRFLGKQRLPRLMMSNAHLNRLLLALVYVIELDCNNVSLLEDITIKNIHDTAYSSMSKSWKEYKFIYDTTIEGKLIVICKLLGEFGDLEILVDYILQLMSNSDQYRKEFILLLNWMLDASGTDPQKISLYKQVVDQYTSQEFWNLPIQVSKDTILREARRNIVQSCLLVEGLGIMAKVMNTYYNHFLLKTLYMVIEKAGSSHGLIRLVGLQSLEKFAQAYGHETIDELIRANVDYLSYHVTVKLRRVERNPGVLDVIAIILEHSTIDFLEYLKNIVDDVFCQLKVSSQKNNVRAFLKVFYTFAICLRKLISNDKTLNDIEAKLPEFDPVQDVIKDVVDYIEAKKASQNFSDETEDTQRPLSEEEIKEGMEKYYSVNSECYEEEGKEIQPPCYIKMMEDVMKNCLNFLPSKELEKSLLSMSILNEGLLILANWENVLLPIVHQIWHPLVERFRDENPLIINRAWQMLVTLARVSKDFIRSRTLKDVLPSLVEFLKKSSKESYKKDSVNVYKFTQTYKLQHEVLSQMGKLAKDLTLFEAELWKILDMTEVYLSSLQNPMLQECCVTLYKDIFEYNSDIVWVKCLSIWHDRIEPIPRDDFDSWYNKAMDTEVRSEYLKNVKAILHYIRHKEKQLYKT